MLDRDTLTDLIEDGRAREVPSEQLAEEILTRASDPVWARAMTHPIRGEILKLLRAEGPMSPVQASQALTQASLGTIAYHFRKLSVLGLIAQERQINRRGAVEHVYRLAATNGHAA